MTGTRWTEPGKGATISQLWKAVVKAKLASPDLWQHLRGLAEDVVRTHTNLAITGEPLTAEDLQRIAETK